MVVTKKTNVSLKALTATALSLPGLFSPVVYAADDAEVDFQYSHYQEGKRDIAITNNAINIGSKSFNPIEVDSMHGSARISLTDRIKFSFNYLQDTWGGATPIVTAPFVASGANGVDRQKAPNGSIVGASPAIYAARIYLDSRLNPVVPTDQIDPLTLLPVYKRTNDSSKLTHVMATASPETRKQGDFKLGYDWDNAGVSVGGGVSIEDDYDSRFGNIGGRLDLNQKQTVLNADLSYTNSYTHATLDHDNYIGEETALPNHLTKNADGLAGKNLVHGTRQDWATHLGLTQVLSKDALVGANFSYTRSTGYMSNPYKGVSVLFIDPDLQSDAPQGGFYSKLYMLYEKRPEVRNQFGVGGHYDHYINMLDAALHFKYQFSSDDWGIQAHTFDADWVQPLASGWTVTPHVRYYSQDAANFYAPYLITKQGFEKPITNANGELLYTSGDGKEYRQTIDPNTLETIYLDAQGNRAPSTRDLALKREAIDPKKLPTSYSSDQRLSGYGTLSGGVMVSKQFAKGVAIDLGFEYYTHQGGLKIGGGGEGSYANFDYWVANANLKINLGALALHVVNSNHSHDQSRAEHSQYHSSHEPAGVMFGHMLSKAGDFMAGYRFMWNSQSGNMLNGNNAISDASVSTSGCGGDSCYIVPNNMNMNMHMLDLMYAPTDWLTLMLMPQFVDMRMDMRASGGLDVKNIPNDVNKIPNDEEGHFIHHLQNPHETGGIGDLGMYALFKLFDNGTHHIHTTVGLSAPTGDTSIQLRQTHGSNGGYIDYGMQLGSGTWDFKPSLTYTGHLDDWSWGVQANGIVRMQDHNKSGYRLGDLFQATAWGSYSLTHWLSASVRGVYTVQGRVQSQYYGSTGGQFLNSDGSYSSILKFGPQDYPQNYGGRFWDVGFGLSAMVPSGALAGNRMSVEWLQPVHSDYNGTQLSRDGALSATWSMAF